MTKKSKTWQGTLAIQPEALEDLTYWVATDRKIALRCLKLIEKRMARPFSW